MNDPFFWLQKTTHFLCMFSDFFIFFFPLFYVMDVLDCLKTTRAPTEHKMLLLKTNYIKKGSVCARSTLQEVGPQSGPYILIVIIAIISLIKNKCINKGDIKVNITVAIRTNTKNNPIRCYLSRLEFDLARVELRIINTMVLNLSL